MGPPNLWPKWTKSPNAHWWVACMDIVAKKSPTSTRSIKPHTQACVCGSGLNVRMNQLKRMQKWVPPSHRSLLQKEPLADWWFSCSLVHCQWLHSWLCMTYDSVGRMCVLRKHHMMSTFSINQTMTRCTHLMNFSSALGNAEATVLPYTGILLTHISGMVTFKWIRSLTISDHHMLHLAHKHIWVQGLQISTIVHFTLT